MRIENERVLCLVIYANRDLSNPNVHHSIKSMILSGQCRVKAEEEALEYTLDEEEHRARVGFGCCDVCSPLIGNMYKLWNV